MLYLAGRAEVTAGDMRAVGKDGPDVGGGAKGSEFFDLAGDHISVSTCTT